MNAMTDERLPATAAWQLEFVRLIAFPDRPPLLIQQDWWKELVSGCGGHADNVVSTQKQHVREIRGTIQDWLLALTVDVARVVWEARSAHEIDPQGSFPTLGPFREKVHWFVQLLGPWLTQGCPSLVRLAFHAKLLQPASSSDEAYRVLAGHLPNVNLESKPNDFLVQVNQRKESSDVVHGLPINRIGTWSKMNVAIVMGPDRPFTWPDRCYSALELDINTAPESVNPLPREVLPHLFAELANLGLEIAVDGATLWATR